METPYTYEHIASPGSAYELKSILTRYKKILSVAKIYLLHNCVLNVYSELLVWPEQQQLIEENADKELKFDPFFRKLDSLDNKKSYLFCLLE